MVKTTVKCKCLQLLCYTDFKFDYNFAHQAQRHMSPNSIRWFFEPIGRDIQIGLYFVSPRERPWRQLVVQNNTLVIAGVTSVFSHAFKKESWDWRTDYAFDSVYPTTRWVTSRRSRDETMYSHFISLIVLWMVFGYVDIASRTLLGIICCWSDFIERPLSPILSHTFLIFVTIVFLSIPGFEHKWT